VLGLDHPLAAVASRDFDLVRFPRAAAREQLRVAGDAVDLVLLEQKRDALADLVGDIAAALDDRGEVGPRPLDEDPELLGAMLSGGYLPWPGPLGSWPGSQRKQGGSKNVNQDGYK
jgi:hypothetical protein